MTLHSATGGTNEAKRQEKRKRGSERERRNAEASQTVRCQLRRDGLGAWLPQAGSLNVLDRDGLQPGGTVGRAVSSDQARGRINLSPLHRRRMGGWHGVK